MKYVVTEFGGGFQSAVTLTNTGSAAWSAWSLEFSFPGSQLISQNWSGQLSQTGSQVTVSNMAWNGGVAAGGEVTVGFIASFSGSNPSPTAFTVNGSTCTTS